MRYLEGFQPIDRESTHTVITPITPRPLSTTTSPGIHPPILPSGRRRWVTEHCRCWLANPIGIVLSDVSTLVPGISPIRIIRARKRAGGDADIRGGIVHSTIRESAVAGAGWVIPAGDNWRLTVGDGHTDDDDSSYVWNPEAGMGVTIIRAPRFVVIRARFHPNRPDIDDIRTLDELVAAISEKHKERYAHDR